MPKPLYTRAEIIQKIKDVDAAIDKAILSDSYSINGGMTSQSVKNQSLAELRKMRQYWLDQLAELDSQRGCGSGLTPIRII